MLATRCLTQNSRLITNYCRRLAQRNQVLRKCQSLLTVHVRTNSTDAGSLMPPPVEGELKQYSPRIHKIVDEISSLTLLEAADLNELLKKTLKIQDIPVMTAGVVAAAAPVKQEEVEAEAPVQPKKSLYSVKLVKFDDAKKIQLIKDIKNLVPGMNLVQAKKFVETAPQVVKGELSKEEAEKLKEALVASGGEAVVE